MDERERLIPKIIWILWYQGASEAPFIVSKCIDSWIRENSTWDVVVLDSSNLNNYVDLDMPNDNFEILSMAQKSDLIRLFLLSKYGGVWADATTICKKPLDEWIYGCTESGFFVFEKPGRDRIMSSWFIASEKGSPICTKLYGKLKSYWVENRFSKPNKAQEISIIFLTKTLNRSYKTTKYWFNPIVTKILKVCPYFALHYMFERLVSTDTQCISIWEDTKRISASNPLLIREYDRFSPPTQSLKQRLDRSDIPLLKLTWKYDHSRYATDTLLHYLIEGDFSTEGNSQ